MHTSVHEQPGGTVQATGQEQVQGSVWYNLTKTLSWIQVDTAQMAEMPQGVPGRAVTPHSLTKCRARLRISGCQQLASPACASRRHRESAKIKYRSSQPCTWQGSLHPSLNSIVPSAQTTRIYTASKCPQTVISWACGR